MLRYDCEGGRRIGDRVGEEFSFGYALRVLGPGESFLC